MIITGYQGIGKSTLASKNDKIIDLESGSFWKTDEFPIVYDACVFTELCAVERSRPKDWYVYYCQIAQHLSRQGYIVFVSCHAEVREYLMRHNEESFCAIFPSLDLKEAWLQRLSDRYDKSHLTKDAQALHRAVIGYSKDISQLVYECRCNVEYYKNVEIIKDINYNLQELVDKLIAADNK